MKLKRILAAVMSVAMLGTMSMMTGCNSNKKYKVGICQLAQHPALDAATDGFMDVLKEKIGEDNIEFDKQNANGDTPACTTIITKFISGNVDLIMANATGALQAAQAGTDSIPIVGTSITDYTEALGEGWTGKNITGASDLVSIADQEDILLEVFPNVKKVGILYCSAEPNSKFQADQMIAALEEDNIPYGVYTVTESNDIPAQVNAATSTCDVLYIPTDNTIASATGMVKSIVVDKNIPVVAGEESICKGCGTITLSISYYDLGKATGEMAYEILVNGKDPGSMDVARVTPTKMYNKEICDALGITIPEGFVEIS